MTRTCDLLKEAISMPQLANEGDNQVMRVEEEGTVRSEGDGADAPTQVEGERIESGYTSGEKKSVRKESDHPTASSSSPEPTEKPDNEIEDGDIGEPEPKATPSDRNEAGEENPDGCKAKSTRLKECKDEMQSKDLVGKKACNSNQTRDIPQRGSEAYSRFAVDEHNNNANPFDQHLPQIKIREEKGTLEGLEHADFQADRISQTGSMDARTYELFASLQKKSDGEERDKNGKVITNSPSAQSFAIQPSQRPSSVWSSGINRLSILPSRSSRSSISPARDLSEADRSGTLEDFGFDPFSASSSRGTSSQVAISDEENADTHLFSNSAQPLSRAQMEPDPNTKFESETSRRPNLPSSLDIRSSRDSFVPGFGHITIRSSNSGGLPPPPPLPPPSSPSSHSFVNSESGSTARSRLHNRVDKEKSSQALGQSQQSQPSRPSRDRRRSDFAEPWTIERASRELSREGRDPLAEIETFGKDLRRLNRALTKEAFDHARKDHRGRLSLLSSTEKPRSISTEDDHQTISAPADDEARAEQDADLQSQGTSFSGSSSQIVPWENDEAVIGLNEPRHSSSELHSRDLSIEPLNSPDKAQEGAEEKKSLTELRHKLWFKQWEDLNKLQDDVEGEMNRSQDPMSPSARRILTDEVLRRDANLGPSARRILLREIERKPELSAKAHAILEFLVVLAARSDVAKEKLKQQEKECEKLRQKACSRRQKVLLLTQQLKSKKKDLNELQREVCINEAESREAQSTAASVEDEDNYVEELEHEIDTASNERGQLEAKLRTVREQAEESQSMLAKTQATIEPLQEQCGRLEATVETLQANKRSLKEQLEATREAEKQARSGFAESRKETENLQAQYRSAEQRAKLRIIRLEDELAQRCAGKNSTSANQSRLDNELSLLRKMNQQLVRQLEGVQLRQGQGETLLPFPRRQQIPRKPAFMSEEQKNKRKVIIVELRRELDKFVSKERGRFTAMDKAREAELRFVHETQPFLRMEKRWNVEKRKAKMQQESVR